MQSNCRHILTLALLPLDTREGDCLRSRDPRSFLSDSLVCTRKALASRAPAPQFHLTTSCVMPQHGFYLSISPPPLRKVTPHTSMIPMIPQINKARASVLLESVAFQLPTRFLQGPSQQAPLVRHAITHHTKLICPDDNASHRRVRLSLGAPTQCPMLILTGPNEPRKL